MPKLICLIILMLTGPVFAVGTSHWTHTNEADFKRGNFHDSVATNLGDLKLSRAVEKLLEQDPRITGVYCLVEAADGTIYAGTGPEGVILQIRGKEVKDYVVIDGATNIFALAFDNQNRLLVGTGGETGRVLRIDQPQAKPHELLAPADVQYIWSLRQMPDGMLYAATGPNGQLFEIKPDGSHSVILDSNEHNLLSLVSDGKDLLYVGTDPNGLIYRLDRKTKNVFVLYDAPETEISSLVLDTRGTLYAATAQAVEEGAEEAPATPPSGRPEPAAGVPIPSQEPNDPAPPEVPDPNPAEPEPIPHSATPVPVPSGTEATDDADVEDPVAVPGEEQDDRNAKAGGGPPVPANGAGGGEQKAEGNAVYRIDSEGFVTEIFRQQTMNVSMIERDGMLLVGTGDDGLIYQVNPAAEETVVLAKVDPKQVMSLMQTRDGRVVVGTANVGGLATLSSGYAAQGTFTSPVLDATQVSRFGKMRLQGLLPKGTQLTVATRSGNVQEPGAIGWSDWSAEIAATEFVQIASPPARFLQYRLTFKSSDAKESPVVDEVDVAYQLPNLPPAIKAIKVTPDPKAAPQNGEGEPSAVSANPIQAITWEAADANEDTLQFSIYFRRGTRSPWILIKDALTEAQYSWDTRTVGDGRYELKVVATDSADNPRGQERAGSRVSDPIMVDNTAPLIGDVKINTQGTQVAVELKVVDRTSTVSGLHYAVDSNKDWQAVLPSDKIFDGPEETLGFTITGLSPGVHQVTLRATDARNNQAFESLLVTIQAPTAAGQ